MSVGTEQRDTESRASRLAVLWGKARRDWAAGGFIQRRRSVRLSGFTDVAPDGSLSPGGSILLRQDASVSGGHEEGDESREPVAGYPQDTASGADFLPEGAVCGPSDAFGDAIGEEYVLDEAEQDEADAREDEGRIGLLE